jgi:hypothetical protein
MDPISLKNCGTKSGGNTVIGFSHQRGFIHQHVIGSTFSHDFRARGPLFSDAPAHKMIMTDP